MVGIPAPNPSYEIPIKNVTGNANIKIQNKNLAWNDWAEDLVNRINDIYKATITSYDNRRCLRISKDVSYPLSATNYLFKTDFKLNTQYTVSFDCYTIYSSGTNLNLSWINDENSSISPTLSIPDRTWTKVTMTNTSGTTISSLAGRYRSEGYTYIDLDTFQIEEGTTATSYVPHAEQNLPLTLGDIELCKMDTSQDYFYKENGKWYLTKNTIKRNLKDFDYTRSVLSSGNISFRRNVIYYGDYTSINVLSSHLRGISDNQGNVLNSIRINNGNNLYITVADNEISSSTDTFKNWCNTNNVVAYFKFKSPIITEITDTTLINQLEAILQAKSYDDQTDITSTSDELGFKMDVESLGNINTVINNLLNN